MMSHATYHHQQEHDNESADDSDSDDDAVMRQLNAQLGRAVDLRSHLLEKLLDVEVEPPKRQKRLRFIDEEDTFMPQQQPQQQHKNQPFRLAVDVRGWLLGEWCREQKRKRKNKEQPILTPPFYQTSTAMAETIARRIARRLQQFQRELSFLSQESKSSSSKNRANKNKRNSHNKTTTQSKRNIHLLVVLDGASSHETGRKMGRSSSRSFDFMSHDNQETRRMWESYHTYYQDITLVDALLVQLRRMQQEYREAQQQSTQSEQTQQSQEQPISFLVAPSDHPGNNTTVRGGGVNGQLAYLSRRGMVDWIVVTTNAMTTTQSTATQSERSRHHHHGASAILVKTAMSLLARGAKSVFLLGNHLEKQQKKKPQEKQQNSQEDNQEDYSLAEKDDTGIDVDSSALFSSPSNTTTNKTTNRIYIVDSSDSDSDSDSDSGSDEDDDSFSYWGTLLEMRDLLKTSALKTHQQGRRRDNSTAPLATRQSFFNLTGMKRAHLAVMTLVAGWEDWSVHQSGIGIQRAHQMVRRAFRLDHMNRNDDDNDDTHTHALRRLLDEIDQCRQQQRQQQQRIRQIVVSKATYERKFLQALIAIRHPLVVANPMNHAENEDNHSHDQPSVIMAHCDQADARFCSYQPYADWLVKLFHRSRALTATNHHYDVPDSFYAQGWFYWWQPQLPRPLGNRDARQMVPERVQNHLDNILDEKAIQQQETRRLEDRDNNGV